jgi:hypothetical protein
MGVRLYAVLRLLQPSRAALPPGLSGERLRILNCGGLSAAVANSRGAIEPSAENLLEFDRSVRALADISEAILPARFGMLAPSEARLKSELADDRRNLSAALELVSGRVQMTLRLPPHEISRVPDKSGRGTKYLKARAATSPALASVRGAADDLVHAERVQSGPQGTRIYHLIEKGDVALYRASLAKFQVRGPFPPYAFVPGIDHALSAEHEVATDKAPRSRSARSGPRRGSPRNAHR